LQSNCSLGIQYSWFNQDCRSRINYYASHSKFETYATVLDWDFWQRDARVREPVLFAVAMCVADKIYNPLSGAPMDLEKSQFVYFILIIDFSVVFIMICFINLLEKRYKEYAEIFDKCNVEMRDFTVEVLNLPLDHEFGGKDLMLQA